MFKKALSIVFLMGFIFSSVAQATPAVDLALSQQLARFHTYVATFTQMTYDGQGRLLQKGQGQVMIMRPGFFRWETSTPTRQILITDSKTLWIYDIDLAQATRQQLNQKTTINPASLLSGSAENLKQQFNIALTTVGANEKQFLLQPKQTDMSFKSIMLSFQRNRLTRMKVLNNLDETSEYQFSQIKMNIPLSISLFKFKAPPGVDVVNQ